MGYRCSEKSIEHYSATSQKTCHCLTYVTAPRRANIDTLLYMKNVKRLFPIVVVSIVVLKSLPAMSQSIIGKTGNRINDTIQISNVTVTRHKYVPGILSSSPVQTLSHEQMQQMGVTDAGDALKHFAGVQVKDYAGIGGLKTVNIRGLGAQHTGVIYDGVQVGDCQSGQVDLSKFTLDNISTLSLSIGQDDNIYRSAKSYASAANIEITSISAHHDKAFGGNANVRIGSYGLAEPSLFLNQNIGKLSLSEYAAYQRADGSYDFKLWNGTHLIDSKRHNSDIETWRGEINALLRISKKQTLKWKLYGFDSHRGLPGPVIYDNEYSAERLIDKNVFTQLQYENLFSQRIKFKAAAKWNYSWNRDNNVKEDRTTSDTYRQNETYLTATLWAEPVNGLHVALSQDYAHNYLSMTIDGCPYPTRNSFWTSVAADYKGIRNVVINASLLATNISERVKVGEASDGFHRLSPAFSMQWKVAKGLRLRLSYKDIFRTPTLNDLYYTGIGRRTLRPEKTRQWNVGITYSHENRNGNGIALTLDGYYGRVTDKIVAVPRMFLWQMMNVGKVRSLGIDATATGSLTLADRWSVDITAAYSYMNATDRTDASEMNYGDQIAYTPQHSGSGSVTLHSPFADITYNVLLTGHRYMLGYNIPANRMPGFADHSITASKAFSIGSCRMRLQLDIKNLGNKNYEVVRYYPMPGTNVLFTTGFEW